MSSSQPQTRSTKAEEKIYIKSATVDGQVELANDSSRDIEINGYYFIVNGNDKVAISDNPTIQAHKTYEMNVSGYLNRDGKDIIALYSSEDVNTDSYLITNESQPVEFSVASGFYSEDFIIRMKGCIVQHHGKLEYGSPREMKMEESFILNSADSIDATMNKISQMKEKTAPNNWSEYDRKLETRVYF